MAMVRARRTADGAVVLARPDGRETALRPRADWSRVDTTTEAEIARQDEADTAAARQDAAPGHGRCGSGPASRRKPSPRGSAYPTATVRNWEQGKRLPRGPARALLRVMAREPEAVRRALSE